MGFRKITATQKLGTKSCVVAAFKWENDTWLSMILGIQKGFHDQSEGLLLPAEDKIKDLKQDHTCFRKVPLLAARKKAGQRFEG